MSTTFQVVPDESSQPRIQQANQYIASFHPPSWEVSAEFGNLGSLVHFAKG